MLRCPRCAFMLSPYRHGGTKVDHCKRCGGSYIEPGTISATMGATALPENWKDSPATYGPSPSTLGCPTDLAALQMYQVGWGEHEVEVDVCPTCSSMWLDKGEGKALVQAIASYDMSVAEHKNPGGILGYLFQLLSGFPIEVWNPLKQTPYLVYGILALLAAIFLWQEGGFWDFEKQAELLMLTPNAFWKGERVWTVVTNGFLHGSWMHLIGNAYYLWIFGDNVEDTLGRGRFAIIFVLSLVGGGLAHSMVYRGSGIPLLGASGAVFGLLAAYLVIFPKTKLWIVFFFVRFKIPVYVYLGFWVGYQVLMASVGGGDIAWFAHIGGFVVGAALALLMKRRAVEDIVAVHMV